MLLNLNTEEATIYKCGEWLSKKEGDGKTVRELAAEVDGQKAMEGKTSAARFLARDIVLKLIKPLLQY